MHPIWMKVVHPGVALFVLFYSANAKILLAKVLLSENCKPWVKPNWMLNWFGGMGIGFTIIYSSFNRNKNYEDPFWDPNISTII